MAMNHPVRKHGETQKQYRKRLRDEKLLSRAYLRGRYIWHSASKGTYIRKIHGEIGRKLKDNKEKKNG